jgi:CheY-like chemotaxis protein
LKGFDLAMRILVVDDEIDTLTVMVQALEIKGHTAIQARNGKDALTLAQSERLDCALLDVMMPIMDGYTLCRMLRLNPLTRDLPVVFMTAYPTSDLETRCREAGGDAILPKPLGLKPLLATIEDVIKKRQAGKLG